MREQFTVSAPGKIHLLGEHVVVDGKPAILAAVDRRTTVRLTPNDTPDIEISSTNLDRTVKVSQDEVHGRRERAQLLWEKYRDENDIEVLTSITEDEMEYPIIAVGEALRHFGRDVPSGFSMSIDSDVPIGAGLGSSAATAVSVVAAMTLFLGEELEDNRGVINDIAFLVEQKKHGVPSGGDNSAVSYGGLIWFRKESPELKIIEPVPFSVPDKISQNFFIMDTGRPKESTGELIDIVKKLRQNDPEMVEGIFDDQERLTRDLLGALKNGSEEDVMEIIKAGSHNLQDLGIVSPSTRKLISEIEEAGGVAKICGAGGSTEASGVVLSYHPDTSKLKEIASGHKLKSYDAVLGAEGLRRD